MPDSRRTVTTAVLLIAAAISVACVLRVGHLNPSRLLILMFVLWVLAPFAGYLWMLQRSSVGSQASRSTFVVMSVLSLIAYGWVTFGPPMRKPASVFLVVPAISLLVSAIVMWILPKKRLGASDGRLAP